MPTCATRHRKLDSRDRHVWPGLQGDDRAKQGTGEKLVVSGKLRHGGNPVLRWMASNVAVEMDAAGNLKPSKKKSTERIDGIVACIMALGRAMIQPEDSGSVYETRGLITL